MFQAKLFPVFFDSFTVFLLFWEKDPPYRLSNDVNFCQLIKKPRLYKIEPGFFYIISGNMLLHCIFNHLIFLFSLNKE